MSLKTGWAETGNVMTAMLGFAICAGAGGRRGYSRLENNVTQVTAVAAGSMSFTAGLVASMPALWLLEHRSFSPWALAIWGFALGVLGTLVGMLLRKQLVVDERLPFPTGSATAEIIDALHG